MSEATGKAEGRRTFLASLGRATLLVATGLVGGAAIGRQRRPLDGQRCVNGGLCRGCAAFGRCGLPQALSAKQAMEKR